MTQAEQKIRVWLSNNLLTNNLRRQIFLFLLVGGLCYVISIVLLVVLVESFQMEVNLANLISSLIATYAAYELNRKFIFEGGRHAPAKEISAFFFFSMIGLLLNVALMYLMTTYTPIWYVISKTIITVVVAAFNFATRKFLVFNG